MVMEGEVEMVRDRDRGFVRGGGGGGVEDG